MWMSAFDNETCKDLFNLVSAYNMGMTDKNKIREYIKSHGLNPDDYTETVRKVIEDEPLVYSHASLSETQNNDAAKQDDGLVSRRLHNSRRKRRR